MKEYEYIVGALEGYLCDELTGVICSENYRSRSYEHGYRNIFTEYRELHKNFEINKAKFTDLNLEQSVREEFQNQCQIKCKDARDRFLKDIQACSDVDIKSSMDRYLKKLGEEEVQTVSKRICLYPYLVSLLREKEKGGEINGKRF